MMRGDTVLIYYDEKMTFLEKGKGYKTILIENIGGVKSIGGSWLSIPYKELSVCHPYFNKTAYLTVPIESLLKRYPETRILMTRMVLVEKTIKQTSE